MNYRNDDGEYDYNSARGYEWTDEDAQDAITDGMYGDYLGSGWDQEVIQQAREHFCFAKGREGA